MTEDLTKFNPDWHCDNCIEHVRNHIATAKLLGAAEAEIAALREENKRLQTGHRRYETVRRMNAQQFTEAFRLNISTSKPFDEIIDDLAPFMVTEMDKP